MSSISIKNLFIILIPLAVLMVASILASIIGYGLLLGFGDIFPLDKVISKIAKVLLVLSIFPAMYFLSLTARDLGFAPLRVFQQQFMMGLLIGLITLMPVLIFFYMLDINVVDSSKPWTVAWVLKNLVVSLLLSALISFAEEPIFRGVLFAGLIKKIPVFGVIMTCSAYYALLHFLKSHTHFSYQELDFFSGFILLGEAYLNVLRLENLPVFLALFMVGGFLAVLRTYVKTSLGLCIGCHTAWVWQIKMNKSMLNANPNSDYFFLASKYDGVIGPFVALWMLVAILVMIIYFKRQQMIESKC